MSNTSVEAAIGGFVSALTTNILTWVLHRLQLTQGKKETLYDYKNTFNHL